MDESFREAFSPGLGQFCTILAKNGIVPHEVDAELVARYFRAVFQIPCPVTFRDAGVLLFRLALSEVYFAPGMEERQQIRGAWFERDSVIKIFVDNARPPASIIKTLLHELGEIILSEGYRLHSITKELSIRKREQWARRFAAMIKMPPNLFRPDATECSLNLRELAEKYKDSIAGVSRQVRDLNTADLLYYFCRFDIERKPEKNCKPLLKVIEASGGVPIKIADVVRTPFVNIRRRRGGALPAFNLPSSDHYRVMHQALHKYISTSQPVFIPSLHGGAALEGGWGDLFGDQDLAVLIRPYGWQRVQGFFLMAFHPSKVHLIEDQIEAIHADVRSDIGWLFSWASYRQKHGYPQATQLTLALEDENGNLIGKRYPWAHVKPVVEIDGKEVWHDVLSI